MKILKNSTKSHQKTCSHPSCDLAGDYPAPKSRKNLNERIYFCLEHIRQYNKSWNYFTGLSSDEIHNFHHESLFGHRETRKVGINSGFNHKQEEAVRDELFSFLFGDDEKQAPKKKINNSELSALKTLGVELPATAITIKRQYKLLAKKYHPDLNKGINSDKFKSITEAYNLLKRAGYTG